MGMDVSGNECTCTSGAGVGWNKVLKTKVTNKYASERASNNDRNKEGKQGRMREKERERADR